MTPQEYATAVDREAALLASAALSCGLEAAVPTCPGWVVRDLLRHLGHVHRWATRYLQEEHPEPLAGQSEAEILSSGPPDGDLVGWLLQGAGSLSSAIATADPELHSWTFLAAPSSLLFWARRQAHETAIHRADLELAGGLVTPYPAPFAADGIDEILMGFAYRSRHRNRREVLTTVLFEAADHPSAWQMRIGPQGMEVEQGPGATDCVVRASASDLYLLLWNRPPAGEVQVLGPRDGVDWWRESFKVRWG